MDEINRLAKGKLDFSSPRFSLAFSISSPELGPRTPTPHPVHKRSHGRVFFPDELDVLKCMTDQHRKEQASTRAIIQRHFDSIGTAQDVLDEQQERFYAKIDSFFKQREEKTSKPSQTPQPSQEESSGIHSRQSC